MLEKINGIQINDAILNNYNSVQYRIPMKPAKELFTEITKNGPKIEITEKM